MEAPTLHVYLLGPYGDVRRAQEFVSAHHLDTALIREIYYLCRELRREMLNDATTGNLKRTISGVDVIMHREEIPGHDPEDEEDYYRCESTETGCDEWDLSD